MKYTKTSSPSESVTIADILHYAADKCLAKYAEQCWTYGGSKEKYSCCAVDEACFRLMKSDNHQDCLQKSRSIKEGLKNMGCPIGSMNAFDDQGQFVEENQQARYAWLKFAAMMAEEQGV
jgi:hypothetical protein